jgi:hypothetical protein
MQNERVFWGGSVNCDCSRDPGIIGYEDWFWESRLPKHDKFSLQSRLLLIYNEVESVELIA